MELASPRMPVITILKDWRIQVGVYRNDTLTVFHAGQMLDSSGDAEGQIYFGMNEATGSGRFVLKALPSRSQQRGLEAPTEASKKSASLRKASKLCSFIRPLPPAKMSGASLYHLTHFRE